MTTPRRTLALSLAVAACLLLAACAADPEPESDQTAGTAPADGATAAAQGAAVRMADISFDPASISVAPGTTITWTNDDSVPHTVSFGDAGPESDTIDPEGTFEATLDEAGSYPYVCTLHPGMEGTIEVDG